LWSFTGKGKELVDACAIRDTDVEVKLHLQSSWLLRPQLERAKTLVRMLSVNYVAGRIAESFEADLFVTWSEDNAEKTIIRYCVREVAKKDEDGLCIIVGDICLRRLENSMLNSFSLCGVPGTKHVSLTEPL
jgi:DNA-directed RNA polymerase II subunit RPB1